MEDFIESKIKGTIAETIVEEMFQKLGFYVLKLGKEHTVNPLTQLNKFVRACGGKFYLKKDPDFMEEISYIDNLPDFLIISPEGEAHLLEVKFRKNAKFWLKDKKVFENFPGSHMLIVNSDVSGLSLDDGIPQEKLKQTHFHLWIREQDTEKDKVNVSIMPFKLWLKKDFNVENEKLLEKYEKLVEKWFTKEQIEDKDKEGIK